MIAGIVLAAGASTRFAPAHKLLMPYRAKTIVYHTLQTVLNSKCSSVILVTGCRHLEMEAALENLIKRNKLTICHNPKWSSGRASSLKLGIECVCETNQGFLTMPADMPLMSTNLINAVLDTFESTRRLCFPVYNLCKGHPVVFPMSWKSKLCSLKQDESGFQLIQSHWGHASKLERTDHQTQLNLNTPNDYAHLMKDLP